MSDDETPGDPVPRTASALPSIIEPLLALIQPTALSFPPQGGPSPHPPTTSALSTLHTCAFECLNNAFLSLARPAHVAEGGQTFSNDADRAAGPRIWNEVWRALEVVGTGIDGPGQEQRREMWQIGVGVLWGGRCTLEGDHRE